MTEITKEDVANCMTELKKLNSDLPDWDLMNWNVHRLMAAQEENILLNIAEQYLGRKPIPEEDGPKFTKVFREGEPNNYTITYLGVSLGLVRRFHEGTMYNITFTPQNEL